MPEQDAHFMQLALAQAKQAFLAGEVPVGAVVVKDGQVIASAHNAPLGQTTPLPTPKSMPCALLPNPLAITG